MDKEFGYEDESKKKFQIKRWMVIVAALVLILIIVLVLVIVHIIKSKEPEYTLDDFKYLENRMVEETPTYLSQKNIELTNEKININLNELLDTNGGSISSKRAKASKICKGYVIAFKEDTESYNAYISCGKYYTTSGYVSNNDKELKKTTTKKDTQKPSITIIGEKELTIRQGTEYKDQGAQATDNIDGDLTSKIKVSGSVDINKVGTYTLTYTVTDKAGNRSETTRKVIVEEVTTTTQPKPSTTTKKSSSNGTQRRTTTKRKVVTTTRRRITTPPTLTLRGQSYKTLNVGQRYDDPGYYAVDALGNDISSRVRISGGVNTSVAGTYTIRYSVTDSFGNSASKVRTVKVISNYIKLQRITLSPNSITLRVGGTQTLTVGFSPSNATNKSISWSSEDPSVATVSNGVVRGVRKGSTSIIVRGADGASGKTMVIVK